MTEFQWGDSHPERRDLAKDQQDGKARVVDYFLGYAKQFWGDYNVMDRERLNLFTAMDWAEQVAASQHIMEFAQHLFDFLWVRGLWDEIWERITQGLT